MRRSPSAFAAVIVAFSAPAAADDASDCIGGDPAKGIPACTRIIERAGTLQDRLADAYNNRGKLYIVQGQIERARADLDEALRRNPRHANAHHNRGVAFLMTGQNDKGLAELSEAVRLNSKDAESRFARGRSRRA